MRELDPYIDQLKELAFVKGARLLKMTRAHSEADALLEVRTSDGRVTFDVEHKRSHLSRAIADHVLRVRADRPNLLLFCPHVSRDLAERFGREHLNFVDLAGNCHVEIGDRFFAHVEGRRHEPKPPSHRALRAPSYRVIFALLVKPELSEATARELAEAAGRVSPQTAIDARARLIERGVLIATARGAKWAPQGWKVALEEFVGGFWSTLAPQLAIGRFRAKERDVDLVQAQLSVRLGESIAWRWGGGAASARLTGHFRGDRTVVYVSDATPSLPKQLGLLPDAQGPVLLAKSPGALAFQGPLDDCVHPLLAYADLLAEGDERARDGAGELYRRFLAPLERAKL